MKIQRKGVVFAVFCRKTIGFTPARSDLYLGIPISEGVSETNTNRLPSVRDSATQNLY